MKSVQGSWAIEVLAGGRDLALDPSIINHFYIINNIHQHLPTLNFSFKDGTGRELDRIIGDGVPVTVSIGNPMFHIYNGLQFVVMGMPKVDPAGTYNNIGVNAVLNKVGFLKKVVDRAYEGTAATTIAQIAGEAGLIPDVDSTQDFMTWLPNRTTLAQYANHVMERSYAGPNSAMIMAVTDRGVLRFKDLNNLIGVTGKRIASIPKSGEIPALLYAAKPKSVVANSGGGYGSTTIGTRENGEIFEGNEVQMKMMSAGSSISSFMQSAIGSLGSRINILAPLAGNTHEKWYEAQHQNKRIKASYAFDIEILTDIPTQLSLLDVIDFRPMNMATGEPAHALVGKYIVTALTKLITNNRYFEKLVVTAQGAGGI